MKTMTASEARNNIRKLWQAAAQEVVTIESAGKPIAVVLSPEQYEQYERSQRFLEKSTSARRIGRIGAGRHLLQGVDGDALLADVDALLATPLEDTFADYLPDSGAA